MLYCAVPGINAKMIAADVQCKLLFIKTKPTKPFAHCNRLYTLQAMSDEQFFVETKLSSTEYNQMTAAQNKCLNQTVKSLSYHVRCSNTLITHNFAFVRVSVVCVRILAHNRAVLWKGNKTQSHTQQTRQKNTYKKGTHRELRLKTHRSAFAMVLGIELNCIHNINIKLKWTSTKTSKKNYTKAESSRHRWNVTKSLIHFLIRNRFNGMRFSLELWVNCWLVFFFHFLLSNLFLTFRIFYGHTIRSDPIRSRKKHMDK